MQTHLSKLAKGKPPGRGTYLAHLLYTGGGTPPGGPPCRRQGPAHTWPHAPAACPPCQPCVPPVLGARQLLSRATSIHVHALRGGYVGAPCAPAAPPTMRRLPPPCLPHTRRSCWRSGGLPPDRGRLAWAFGGRRGGRSERRGQGRLIVLRYWVCCHHYMLPRQPCSQRVSSYSTTYSSLTLGVGANPATRDGMGLRPGQASRQARWHAGILGVKGTRPQYKYKASDTSSSQQAFSRDVKT